MIKIEMQDTAQKCERKLKNNRNEMSEEEIEKCERFLEKFGT